MKFNAVLTKEMLEDFIACQFDHPNATVKVNEFFTEEDEIVVECTVEPL